MPDLTFSVLDAAVLPYAASPTILFKLKIATAQEDEQIQSVMLRIQVRIEVARRTYDAQSESGSGLQELFGPRERWSETLRSLLWTNTTVIVPPFAGSTVVEVPVVCTYDYEVVGTKYFNSLSDGDVPLLFLLSGTVFFAREQDSSLQIGQIPWEKEARYRLPARVWRETMDSYFPNSAWLRLRKDVFDHLCGYKARRALPTWEATIEKLLQDEEAALEHQKWNQ